MKKTRYIAKLGLLLALASVLQFLESLIPIPLPLGVKPGISSVVIMYILMFMGFAPAMTIAVLKSCFVFVTRGASSFCMSISGGVISVLAMGFCMLIFHRRSDNIGIIMTSVMGGIFHNIGQLIAAAVISGTVYTVSYLPILIIAGIIAGACTGIIMRLLLTRINFFERNDMKNEEKTKRTKT